ncbi:MAG: hypothetical protein ABI158_01260 [Edaphobacter sp.]
MRLPFPEHIPLRYAIYFATLLCIAQLLQGTDPSFSLCCFLFILVATLAFNLAGGFTRPSGGYVFFYAVLAVILGLFWKAFLGEPADSNLTRPLLTMQTELGGITAMFGAVFISRKLTFKRPILGNLLTEANMKSAATGCLIAGLSLTAVLMLVPRQGGSILSALSQLNQFLPLAIILGTIYQIRSSGGASTMNLTVLGAGGVSLFLGVLSFSKQGMFTPILCWLIAAASQRYKTSLYKVIGFTLAIAFMVYYLVPYSQYGRNFMVSSVTVNGSGVRADSMADALVQNLKVSVSLLSDLGYVREQFEHSTKAEHGEGPAYFDTPQGLFDRLQMLSMDDALINETEQNGRFGFSPIIMAFEGVVPHFLWPEKPTVRIGNIYAHEIGVLADDDTVTGISFSPIGEAFHIGRWTGIFLVAPLLWIILFVIFDSLCGDVRKHPWGLLALVLFSHAAPEQLLSFVVYLFWYGAGGIVFVALTASYVMPILGSIFTSSRRTGLRRNVPIRSIPRHLPPVRPSQNSNQ